MVIIEAEFSGSNRIVTFKSKLAAFYFLKSIRRVTIESIITTNMRTKVKVTASSDWLRNWSGAVKESKDYQESDNEFLFFIDYHDIYEYLKQKHIESISKNYKNCTNPSFDDFFKAAPSLMSTLMFDRNSPNDNDIEAEKKRRLDDFISSLDRKIIDIDVFDNYLNKVYLITTE